MLAARLKPSAASSWGVIVVAVAASAASFAHAEESYDSLAEGISALGQKAVAFIDEHGYRNVGVLKFRVQKAGQEVSDRVGTLNTELATQLETALAIYRRTKMGFGVIADASGTAAGIPGASHLTEAGCEKLFSGKYRLAWGTPPETVAADAFIVGVASVAADLRTMDVAIGAVDGSSAAMQKIASVTCQLQPAQLVGIGESFRTRAVMSPGMANVAAKQSASTPPVTSVTPPNPIHQASASAANIVKKQEPFPLEASDSPVGVTITYDGTKVPIEIRDGRAFVVEPREGQKVTIKVEKKRRDGKRIGVVLKVNGENTTKRQSDPDLYCWKWILSDATPAVTVRGYHVDSQQIQPFKVLSAAESQRREIDYGADVGVISVTVFGDASAAPEAAVEAARPDPATVAGGKIAPDLALLTRQVRVASVAAASPEMLREKLLNSVGGAARDRGLMVPSGATEKSNLSITEFSPYPTPEMSAVISYYTASAAPAAK